MKIASLRYSALHNLAELQEKQCCTYKQLLNRFHVTPVLASSHAVKKVWQAIFTLVVFTLARCTPPGISPSVVLLTVMSSTYVQKRLSVHHSSKLCHAHQHSVLYYSDALVASEIEVKQVQRLGTCISKT